MKKNKRGITLIALVITIIVLLILAGVSISMITSQDGILSKVIGAREKQIEAQEKEKEILNSYEQYFEFDDSRLSNEEIKITKAEQLYALSRLLLSNNIKNRYLSAYGTEGDERLQTDLNQFEYPENIRTDTDENKIEYLRTTSYRLENDIELKLLKNAYSSNFAIGGKEKAFSGFFNGNNKKISITKDSEDKRETFCGIFGNVEDAIITNLNVELKDNIEMKLQFLGVTDAGGYIGILVNQMKNTKLYNNSVTLDDRLLDVSVDDFTGRMSVKIGGIVGVIAGKSEIKGCSFNLINGSEIKISNTNNGDKMDYEFGGIVGETQYGDNDRKNISNCMVNISDSKISLVTPRLGYAGGIASLAGKTTITDSKVELKDSSIGITSAGDSYMEGLAYYSLAVGGIVGFGREGSDNTSDTLGIEGVTIKNCSFNSINSKQKEVLYAKLKTGLAPNVGGIMGIVYNNASIIDSNVNITNGTLISEKTEEDSYDKKGSTCGGIIGRLEHTGMIKGSKVIGNNLKIMTISTGKEMYAGGIVGIDIGPWQKNIISLEDNNFIGNGTSEIILELKRGSLENKEIYAGGIAGETAYTMKNCSVSGVMIYSKGADTGVKKIAVGKLAGRFLNKSGMWYETTYFTPNEIRGILNCTVNQDVNISIDDNNSGVVSQGEEYGSNI